MMTSRLNQLARFMTVSDVANKEFLVELFRDQLEAFGDLQLMVSHHIDVNLQYHYELEEKDQP